MKCPFTAFIIACVLLYSTAAHAHRIDEYLQATMLTVQSTNVQASMRLIPGMLVAPSIIAAIDVNRDGFFSEGEEQAYAQRVLSELSITIDDKSVSPQLTSWRYPKPAEMRNGLGEIEINYRVALPQGGMNRSLILANHHMPSASVYLMNALVPQAANIRILAQKRNPMQSVYELDYQQANAANQSAGSAYDRALLWLRDLEFRSLFLLGMRHIAEGTDHLLFLLVLLLPAPLLAAGSRWGRPASIRQSLLRILGTVTAFTIGHSITLGLAAMNFIHPTARPIEVLIAVSILVSAIHALRPLFPGREAWIAAFFGLIHGLAFAATLDRLGLSRWERVAGILAFNLGIESMQMLVVASLLPSLLLLSRTKAYPIFRRGGALFAGAASIGWIAERLVHIKTPVDTLVNGLAQHVLGLAAALFLLSLACRYLPSIRSAQVLRTRATTAI